MISNKDGLVWLKKMIEEYYGNQCEFVESTCPICNAWIFYKILKDCIEEKQVKVK